MFHIPLSIDLAILDDHVQEGTLSQEAVYKPVHRLVVQIFRGVDLHDTAHIADHHPVGDGHGFGLVMSHKDNGKVELALQFLDFEPHALPQLGIQVGEGFIPAASP